VKTSIACTFLVLYTAGLLLGWEIGTSSKKADYNYVAVFVATADLPSGMVMSTPEKFYTVIQCPRGLEPPGAITHLEQIRGRVVVRRVAQGEAFVSRNFVVASAWESRTTGVSGFLTVPVVVPGKIAVSTLPGQTRCLCHRPWTGTSEDLILFNVLVAAVGTGRDRLGRVSVTLLVPQDQVPRLQRYQQTGTFVIL
jgi:hypothetical protein